MKIDTVLETLGLQKITIPLPFRLDHLHCFLVKEDFGYTMIDTGLHDENTKEIWDKVLRDKQIDKIILTHLHPDHTGYAGILQKHFSAPVYMSETDAKAMEYIWTEKAIPILKRVIVNYFTGLFFR